MMHVRFDPRVSRGQKVSNLVAPLRFRVSPLRSLCYFEERIDLTRGSNQTPCKPSDSLRVGWDEEVFWVSFVGWWSFFGWVSLAGEVSSGGISVCSEDDGSSGELRWLVKSLRVSSVGWWILFGWDIGLIRRWYSAWVSHGGHQKCWGKNSLPERSQHS
jgi:hypothetical protein